MFDFTEQNEGGIVFITNAFLDIINLKMSLRVEYSCLLMGPLVLSGIVLAGENQNESYWEVK